MPRADVTPVGPTSPCIPVRAPKAGGWMGGRDAAGKATSRLRNDRLASGKGECGSRKSRAGSSLFRERTVNGEGVPAPSPRPPFLFPTQGLTCAFSSKTLNYFMSSETRVSLPSARSLWATAWLGPCSQTSSNLLTLPDFERFGQLSVLLPRALGRRQSSSRRGS